MPESGCLNLLSAAEKGDSVLLERLIEHGADVNEADRTDMTALQCAAQGGHVDCVNQLLTAGADVNASDKHGVSALMYASRQGYDECVEMLIESGADVNEHNNMDGNTSLIDVACSCPDSFEADGYFGVGRENDAQELSTRDEERERKKRAVRRNVLLLSQAGADLDQVNLCGFTALTTAVRIGNIECVHALIAAGVDVNVTDKNGNTALITGEVSSHVFHTAERSGTALWSHVRVVVEGA